MRSIAGCARFFTLIQCFEGPPPYQKKGHIDPEQSRKVELFAKSALGLLVCVGDPMFKLPIPILQKWGTWLKDQFIGDVPPEDALFPNP
jgi:hypothetical protein